MPEHLGHDKNTPVTNPDGYARNGKSKKTLKGELARTLRWHSPSTTNLNDAIYASDLRRRRIPTCCARAGFFLCKLPAETAVTALPIGKPAGAFQSLCDTGFTAQPLLVQRMVQWQVPLLVGAHSVGVHGGLGKAR